MTENFFSTDIGFEPEIDFANAKVTIENGSPKLIEKLEAIRQWIIKFSITEKDRYEIYIGTGFGTRIKELYGKKKIGYGFEESELERDYREGLPLCPAISEVTFFNVSRSGKTLKIKLQVELYDSELIDITVEYPYIIKGL